MTADGLAPSAVLPDPRVQQVIDRLTDQAGARDADVMKRAYAAVADWSEPPSPEQAAELCEEAALPVDPQVGTYLYQMVRALRPSLVVEFGTSFGISTLYIATALRDNGTGRVIGSEFQPGKAQKALGHLTEAGVDHVAEIRVGDARTELNELPGPIDLLLLDGWKELYLPVLRQLEPHLRAGALVVSDNLPMLPTEFLAHVRGPGYVSQELALGEGIEVSVRLSS
ncbi:O-methyltransferase [Streptomyces kaniharaensis]|uniref:O-methyltransferase n=1 Tax=Streptomyces kaniharaensis TaxID=212423 RepID=UPI002DDD8EAD|nr:class I SAM-dependent methyltransferase [Streptomyces kaniharaensis]